jgi:hypothetical protein
MVVRTNARYPLDLIRSITAEVYIERDIDIDRENMREYVGD